MSRFLNAVALATLVVLPLATPAAAQQAPARSASPAPPAAPVQPASPATPAPQVVYQNGSDARETQQQLRALLRQYPPSLGDVLRIDPALLNRPDYLTPYPALMTFLQQHPEVVRDPSFFFGEYRGESQPQTDRERSLNFIRNLVGAIGFLTGFLVVVSFIYSLLRQALEYRRWRRQVQIQTDVHTKVFDRLTSNQELLAYLETPVAQRFLESSPVVAAGASTMAPVTRIIWSVQIGVVVAAIGAGFWLARATVDDVDISTGFQVMGTLAIAVGIGFIISALVAWLLSLRLGLLRGAKAES